MACHATSAVAAEALAAELRVPVIDVVGPAAAAAVRISPNRRIGVMGARTTILSGAYPDRIRSMAPDARVCQTPCPLIPPLIEAGWLKKPEATMIVKKYLIPLKARKIDTLILGDSHYALLEGVIQRKIGRRVRLVEASAPVVERLGKDPEAAGSTPPGDPPEDPAVFYLSDVAPETDRRAALFLKRRVRFRQVTP